MISLTTPRRRPALRAGTALIALALAATGAVMVPSGVAHAATYRNQNFEFHSTSGENWAVPVGVSSVKVELRGGNGGKGQTAAGGAGRPGESISFVIPVEFGDVLTVFTAQSASGSKDERDGGAGYLRGGTGGKGSGVLGHAGGGGGGAAAVELNGVPVAVAGGGGGGGGSSHQNAKDIPIPGGAGGGGTGGGSTPGAPGINASDVSNAPGRGKPGGDGGSAGFLTSGGGGGGGGAGWPVSGTGGGGGRKFNGYSGGSGGGNGMSWVTAPISGFDRTSDNVPVGTAKISILPALTASLTGPAEVVGRQPVALTLRTTDDRLGLPISGKYTLTLAGNSGETYYPRETPGMVVRDVGRLPVGTHVFTAVFTPDNVSKTYSSTFTVRVVEPAIALAEEPAEAATLTAIDPLPTPFAYGDSVTVGAVVTPDAAVDLTGGDVVFTVDGSPLPARTLTDVGDGTFRATAVVDDLDAGLHSVSADFAGTDAATPSYSESAEFTVAPAATTTEIGAAPSGANAFEPIDVTATVSSDVVAVSGTAELLADGVPVAYAQLDDAKEAHFDDVVIPWGTTELTASYLGGTTGNFAPSVSSAHPITVSALATETQLTISRAQTTAHEPVQFVAHVAATDPAATEDPRGDVDILFDGELALVIPVGLDADPEDDDGEARFELDVAGLELGEHDVTARFVPAPGFEGSESDVVALQVEGSKTQISLAAPGIELPAETSGSVQAETVLLETGAAVSGSVQTFLSGEKLGDPVAAWEGSATVPIPGLPAGTHEVELQFTPEDAGLLPSSASVTVTAVASAGQPPTEAGADQPPAASNTHQHPALARTGGADASALLVGGVILLLLGGVVFGRRIRIRIARRS